MSSSKSWYLKNAPKIAPKSYNLPRKIYQKGSRDEFDDQIGQGERDGNYRAEKEDESWRLSNHVCQSKHIKVEQDGKYAEQTGYQGPDNIDDERCIGGSDSFHLSSFIKPKEAYEVKGQKCFKQLNVCYGIDTTWRFTII